MQSKDYTKAKLSAEAYISRPTLDKILSAQVTNKINFEKHVSKILDCLQVTPDMILGNIRNPYNKIRHLKNMVHISEKEISEGTGISISRLNEIEAGENATLEELRDIACCCRTSVRALLGTEYFEPPFSQHYMYCANEWISGFWGRIGVSLSSEKECRWYPITKRVRQRILNSAEEKYMVVPCMNNKVLVLNMSEVDSITLLDDDCDLPYSVIMDEKAGDSGEIPLAVYDALSDWPDGGDLSPKLKRLLDKLAEKYNWNDDDIMEMVCGVTIFFKEKTDHFFWDTNWHQTVADIIPMLYEWGENDSSSERMFFSDYDGAERIINISKTAMIELPLVLTENMICEAYEEMLSDAENAE